MYDLDTIDLESWWVKLSSRWLSSPKKIECKTRSQVTTPTSRRWPNCLRIWLECACARLNILNNCIRKTHLLKPRLGRWFLSEERQLTFVVFLLSCWSLAMNLLLKDCMPSWPPSGSLLLFTQIFEGCGHLFQEGKLTDTEELDS